jgi:hypothetical protein
MVGGDIAGTSTCGIPSLPRQINFCGQIHVNPWLLIVVGHLDELNLHPLHQHFVVGNGGGKLDHGSGGIGPLRAE